MLRYARKFWFLLVLPGCLLCYVALVIYDELDEGVYTTMSYNPASFDPTSLPEYPTEEDWYRVAMQILIENGGDSSYHLTQLYLNYRGLSCQSGPTFNRVAVVFHRFDFVKSLPSLKMAWVDLDRSTGAAEIRISYIPMRWDYQWVDLNKLKFHSNEVFEIASKNGGADFMAETEGACDTSMGLNDDYKWNVNYYIKGIGEPQFMIKVDGMTGESRQVPLRP